MLRVGATETNNNRIKTSTVHPQNIRMPQIHIHVSAKCISLSLRNSLVEGTVKLFPSAPLKHMGKWRHTVMHS
jgi:hypothetical protein